MSVAGLRSGERLADAATRAAKVVQLRPANRADRVPPNEDLCRLMRNIAFQQSREAFAELFGHFAPRLKAFLMRYGIPEAQSEDLAQETMIAVWRKADTFDPARAGVSTWIFTIARNKRIDQMRRERSAAPPLDVSDEGDPSASGEDLALAAERDAHVRAALASLPQEQAAVVRLSFFLEKPHSEIARELGIPLGTVKSRVRLALARLHAALEREL